MRTNIRIWKIVIFALGVLFVLEKSASAALVTIKISGIVTAVRDLEAYPYNDTVYAGVPFSGTYTYDDAILNTSTHNDSGIYICDAPCGFNISLGNFEFKTVQAHTAQFQITNHNDGTPQPYDRYIIESNQNESLSTGLIVNSIRWSLYDGTHTALSSTALQSMPPILTAWESNTFSIACGIIGNSNAPFAVWGTVTEAVLIPEPTTLILLGIGSMLIRRKTR